MLNEKSTFDEIFKVLALGEPKQFKDAKRIIKKKWNADSESLKGEWSLVKGLIESFDSIHNPLNKAAIISGMDLFFLVFCDEYFEILKNFTIRNLTSPNGHIREAMRHTASWLHISVTDRLDPFVYPEGNPLTPKQAEEQKVAKAQYPALVKELGDLIDKYDHDDENVEYIDDMKPSINKSLQLFWSKLTNSPSYRRHLEETIPISFDLLMKRKEIEKEINDLLLKTMSDFTLDDIKQIIYEEDSNDDMRKLIMMFDDGDISNLDNVIGVVLDAWNHFPHRILEGSCPHEELEKYKNNHV